MKKYVGCSLLVDYLKYNFVRYVRDCLNISHKVNEIYRLIPLAAAIRLRPNIIPANTTFCLTRDICAGEHSNTSVVDETNTNTGAVAILNNKLEVAARNGVKKMRKIAGLRLSDI